jgi:hypothetical protein
MATTTTSSDDTTSGPPSASPVAPTITIRPATDADAPEVASVWAESYHDMLRSMAHKVTFPAEFLAERTPESFGPRATSKVRSNEHPYRLLRCHLRSSECCLIHVVRGSSKTHQQVQSMHYSCTSASVIIRVCSVLCWSMPWSSFRNAAVKTHLLPLAREQGTWTHIHCNTAAACSRKPLKTTTQSRRWRTRLWHATPLAALSGCACARETVRLTSSSCHALPWEPEWLRCCSLGPRRSWLRVDLQQPLCA